jgi:hypothetical protein
MDYDYWWEHAGRSLAIMGFPTAEVSDFARHFARSNLGFPTAAPAAEEMARQLRDWGITDAALNDDARHRPKLVIHRYLCFLSRRRFNERQLALDHPFIAFVKRLPPIPVTAIENNRHFLDGDKGEERLCQALAELRKRLGDGSSRRTVSENLSGIKAALDYEEWVRKRVGQGEWQFADEANETVAPPRVVAVSRGETPRRIRQGRSRAAIALGHHPRCEAELEAGGR